MPEAQVTKEPPQVRDPVRVSVTKGLRGGTGWTIDISGKDTEAVLAEVDRIYKELKRRYDHPREP